MARIVLRRACWAKAVSLSKVMDLRSAGSMRAKTASMTEMVSAAVFPTSLAASVTRDLRSWRTSTGRVRLQMMRSPDLSSGIGVLGPFADGDAILDRISRRPRSERTPAFVTSPEITPQLLGLLGGAVDEGINRLAPHGPQTTFISALQPARDLLGCPPFREAVKNEGPPGADLLH